MHDQNLTLVDLEGALDHAVALLSIAQDLGDFADPWPFVTVEPDPPPPPRARTVYPTLDVVAFALAACAIGFSAAVIAFAAIGGLR